MGKSIELLLETGIDAVWRAVEALTSRACDGLADKGYRVVSPRASPGERSGIVIFEKPGGDAGEHRRIVQGLEQAGVVIAIRNGLMRLSPHAYNTPDEIDRFLDALPPC
jgi:selenocysteine lyase/cysteine desulfurase